MEKEKYCETIRLMIKHETNLRNNRLTWMWTLQGFLFAAYGLLFEKSYPAIICVAMSGIVSSLSIWLGLHICSKAIISLKNMNPDDNDNDRVPPVIGYFSERMRFFFALEFSSSLVHGNLGSFVDCSTC